MHPGARHLAGGEQAGNAAASLEIGAHTAHSIVGGRTDGNHVGGQINVVLETGGMNPRKARLHAAALQMGHVEIDHSLAIPASFDLMNDGARHHVTRGQLGHVVILGHKAHHFHVAQIRAFAAQRFGDQEPWRALHIERSGMELNEFHVTDLGAGAKGHGYAIAGSDGGIGSLAVNLAQAAGGQ